MNEQQILDRAKANYERALAGNIPSDTLPVPWYMLPDSCKTAWINQAKHEIETGCGEWTQEDFAKLREGSK